jgi:hypothetical protein
MLVGFALIVLKSSAVRKSLRKLGTTLLQIGSWETSFLERSLLGRVVYDFAWSGPDNDFFITIGSKRPCGGAAG